MQPGNYTRTQDVDETKITVFEKRRPFDYPVKTYENGLASEIVLVSGNRIAWNGRSATKRKNADDWSDFFCRDTWPTRIVYITHIICARAVFFIFRYYIFSRNFCSERGTVDVDFLAIFLRQRDNNNRALLLIPYGTTRFGALDKSTRRDRPSIVLRPWRTRIIKIK